MTTAVRPIERADVPAAVALLIGGSLAAEGLAPADPSLEVEAPDGVDAYWSAVATTRRHGGEVLVADDGEVVGVVQVIVFAHFQHRGALCGELESVHVRADRRGRGVGGLLLAAGEEHCRRAGCYRIQLTSRHARVDAHRFYLAHGFTATSVGFKKPLEP